MTVPLSQVYSQTNKKQISNVKLKGLGPKKGLIQIKLTWGCFVKKLPLDSLFSSESCIFPVGFLYVLKMYHVRLYIVEKNRVWNGSQTTWDSFQTSTIIVENLHFSCFWNPSCVLRSVPAYIYFGLCTQTAAHVRGLRAILVILFPKIDFCSFKSYIFHFNTPQVNLISDWALN